MKWTTWVAFGGLLSALSVAFGAFGAHALRSRLDDRALEVYETAVRYQMFHALGILFLGLLASKIEASWLGLASWLMAVGIIIFSGSLYTIVFSGIKVFGAITPIGGVLLIAAWLILCWNMFRIST